MVWTKDMQQNEQARAELMGDAAASESALSDLLCMMPKELTAENGAKGLLIGEFYTTFEIECVHCDGSGKSLNGETCCECKGVGLLEIKSYIPWTTIKEIYAMAVKHLST